MKSSNPPAIIGSLDRKKLAIRDPPSQLDTSNGNIGIGVSSMKNIILPNEPLSCQNKLQREKLVMVKNFDPTSTKAIN